MKKQNAIIASKKRKVTEETEITQKDEIVHVQTQIERQISEVDGKKTVHEVEVSTTDNQSTTRSIILRHKETAKITVERLKITEPTQLLQHSHIARTRYRDIETERSSFYNKYPDFNLNDSDVCIEALRTYLAAPFVDYTWYEIMDSSANFRASDIERILLNKLVWNAVFSKEAKEDDTLRKIIDDKTGELSLKSFDTNGSAFITLRVPTHDIDLIVELKYTDPFLLLLIPDKISQARVRNYATSMANDVLALEA